MTPAFPTRPTTAVARGRYALFFSGHECGEERWTIEETSDGVVVTGEQQMVAPHPFPNRNAYRVTLAPNWRTFPSFFSVRSQSNGSPDSRTLVGMQ